MWITLGISAIICLLLTSISSLEFQQNRYIYALIGSFGINRFLLCLSFLVENAVLVAVGYYFNTALMKSEGRSYSDYSNFDVNIIFSLPDLMRLPVDRYTRSLVLFKAEKDLEQKRRELVARLWQTSREAGLEQRKRGTEDASTESRLADRQLKERERALQSREKTQALGARLNDYSAC